MIEYYHDTLPGVKLIRPASFSGSMGRKGYKRRVSGNRMRKFPGAGDVLLIRPSTGFTHPEEGKKLCKKRGKSMRIICNPGRSEQQALNFIFAGMNPVIFSPCAAAAVLLVPFSLWGGEATFMSYNVKNGTGMDGKRDYDRTARVIAEAKPDVAALQELDSKTKRSGGKDTLQELAVRTKLTGTYAKAIDYSGGSYGVGLLSREKPLSVKRIPLPGREEARVLLMAEFRDYCFCVTHLSLTREDSNASIDMIAALAAECRKPFFIAGDFNLTPGSEPIARMKKHFIPLSDFSQKTFPADQPAECIDYIWMYRGRKAEAFKVAERRVIEEPAASDHRPVKVTVRY